MSLNNAVRLEDVVFGWPGASDDVIDIPKLAINCGEHVFIEGPSGCGKSTLLGLFGGVNIPRTGHLQVLEQNLAALSPAGRDRFRANHIGFIFQMFNLVPYLSVLDNIALACRFSDARKKRVVESSGTLKTGAGELLGALDLADRTLWQRPVTDLSIGQQQRVAAARALIGAPEIIIADEPTSALDEGTRERFLELLFVECNRHSTTLILVSHDTRLGDLFHHRVLLPAINRAAELK